MRSNRPVIVLALLVLTLVSCSLSAFAQGPAATLTGRLTDPDGLPVVTVRVQATNVNTNAVASAETNENGLYNIPNLTPGKYRVTVEKVGFEAIVKPDVELHVADIIAINFQLRVGSVTQSVTVQSGVSLVDTTDSSLSGLVNETRMEDLPLNGRNYIDLGLLQPGVSQSKYSIGSGGTAGVAFSSDGAPVVSNTYLLDGTPLVTVTGRSTNSMTGSTLGVDGIKEFKIISTGASAQYGMTMGSQMLLVSKDGTNQFHGDVFEYLRNSALDARNFFDSPKIPPYRRNNFGGSFGGPIKRDKTFFYGVYEGVRESLAFSAFDQVLSAGCHGPAGAVIANVQCPELGATPSVTIPNAQTAGMIALYPLPNVGTNNFAFGSPNLKNVNYGQIRLDHHVSSADSFFGRYTTEQSIINAPSFVLFGGGTTSGGVAFPQFRAGGQGRNQWLTVGETHVLSPTLVNTARLSFARTNFSFVTDYAQPLPPGTPDLIAGQPFGTLNVAGLSTTGAGCCAGPPVSLHLQNIYTFGDDLFYTKGKHGLAFGALINHYNQAVSVPVFTGGAVTYGSVAQFLEGIPAFWLGAAGGADFNRDFIFNTFGFYVQDDWRVKPRLTLNLGLRYEFNSTPRELNGKEFAIRDFGLALNYTRGPVFLNKSLYNFAPRLGFAWDVLGNARMSIRGAFGIYYDTGNWGQSFTQNAYGTPPAGISFVPNIGNPVVTFPVVFPPAALIGGSPAGPFYNNAQPRLMQYNLSVQQQLPGHTSLSVAYVGSRGVHLWAERQGNPTFPQFISPGNVEYWSTAAANTCQFSIPSCRKNPNFTSWLVDITNARSWYDSLQVEVNKRLSSGLQLQGAYTWSHTLDTASGQEGAGDCTAVGMNFAADPLFFNLHDKGPTCFDFRHNLHFNLLYHFPKTRSNNFFTSTFVNGWWMGNIVAVQSGYAFSPVPVLNRAQSGFSTADRVSIGTATVAPGQVGPDGNLNSTTATFIPFNRGTVITGNPQQWFNSLMFALPPMVPCPNNTELTCGTLGDAPRGLLRGPGLGTWDFSIAKDTPLRFLGEAGSVQFRAEIFNILNRSNFGMPNGVIFTGSAADIGAYSEAPFPSAGQITSTSTSSRQIQFALKIIF